MRTIHSPIAAIQLLPWLLYMLSLLVHARPIDKDALPDTLIRAPSRMSLIRSFVQDFGDRLRHHVLRVRYVHDLSFQDLERVRFYARLTVQNKLRNPSRQCNQYRFDSEHENRHYKVQYLAYKDFADNYIIVFRPVLINSRRNMWIIWRLFQNKCMLGDQKCGRVHYGIQKAYLALKKNLQETLLTARSVSFVGHSLGGALALMAAYDFSTAPLLTRKVPLIHVRASDDSEDDELAGFAEPTPLERLESVSDKKQEELPVREVVTFGSPRIGNYNFEKAFSHANIADFRVATTIFGKKATDPITNVPAIWLGYSEPFRDKVKVRSLSNIDFHSGLSYVKALEVGEKTHNQCPIDL